MPDKVSGNVIVIHWPFLLYQQLRPVPWKVSAVGYYEVSGALVSKLLSHIFVIAAYSCDNIIGAQKFRKGDFQACACSFLGFYEYELVFVRNDHQEIFQAMVWIMTFMLQSRRSLTSTSLKINPISGRAGLGGSINGA